MHLVGFIVRNYDDARSPERKNGEKKFAPVHAMQKYGEIDLQLHSFLTSALIASFMPRPVYPGKNFQIIPFQ